MVYSSPHLQHWCSVLVLCYTPLTSILTKRTLSTCSLQTVCSLAAGFGFTTMSQKISNARRLDNTNKLTILKEQYTQKFKFCYP